MKQKILVLGATGMAGHMIYLYLKGLDKYEMSNMVFRTKLDEKSLIIDVNDKSTLSKAIKLINPNIIINCIGILIKGSSDNPINAIYINSCFPHLLKSISEEIGANLIHISTDCVFSGNKGNYNENDFRDADDIYGRSKALGEIINDKDLTIRTSIIGPELKQDGEGLFHWFMNQQGAVQGYKTAIWGGVTTLELAKAIDYAILNKTTGLIQLSNGLGISKYELLCLFKEIWKKNIEIKPVEKNGIDKSIAKSNVFHYEVPSYKNMLNDQFIWMESNKIYNY
ncbi:MAG: SDR family oxidoreductase [Muribaculaceae bacterium]